MTDTERQRFFDDLARVFLRSAVREYLHEIEEQLRRERAQPSDERELDHCEGASAP